MGYFLLGIVFCVCLLFAAVWGANVGLNLAVDKTIRDGYFETYGKKYKAVEIKDNG